MMIIASKTKLTVRKFFLFTIFATAIVYAATDRVLSQPSPSNSEPSPSAATAATADEKKTISKTDQFVSPEMVTAVGGLWPLALLGVIGILVIILRKPFRQIVENIVTKSEKATDLEIKGGPLGLSMKSASTEIMSQVSGQVTPEPQKEVQAEASAMVVAESKLDPPTKEIGDPAQNLVSQLFDALDQHSVEKVENVYSKMQDVAANSEQKIKNEVMYLYSKFKLGDASAIKRLKELTKKPESSAAAYVWLALSYQTAGDLKRAGEAFEKGAEQETDVDRKANSIVSAATCYFGAGMEEKAIELLIGGIRQTDSNTALKTLYTGLASLYKRNGKMELRMLSLEKAIEHGPNDTSTLFDAAYAFGDTEMLSLSVAHYRSVLSFDPNHQAAMNNLGVAYQNLTMPIHSVNAYRKAVDMGNTRAAANIAYLLMNAGFARDAKEILDTARVAPDVDANVGGALAALDEKNSAEDAKLNQLVESALRQQEFLRVCGDQFFAVTTKYEFVGTWILSDGSEVLITQVDERLTMSWTVGGKEYELAGVVSGNAAIVTLRKMEYGYLDPKVKLGFKEASKGYAVLRDEGSRIEVMLYDKGEPSFRTLTKSAHHDSPTTDLTSGTQA